MKAEYLFWQQIKKWFIHVQNAYFNMSVNESHEQNLFSDIFK